MARKRAASAKPAEVKLMTEEAGVDKAAQEMAKTLLKMAEERDDKIGKARDHLVSTLEVTADKYRTANGVMAALDTVRMVVGKDSFEITEEVALAKSLALEMASVTLKLAEAASHTPAEDFDKICDGTYDTDFASGDGSVRDMVLELMCLNLCQNVGPDAQDVKDFYVTAVEEIEKAQKDLEEFCKTNDLDINEVTAEL